MLTQRMLICMHTFKDELAKLNHYMVNLLLQRIEPVENGGNCVEFDDK